MKKFYLANAFRSIDVFGHPINVNHKGNSSHQSLLGACLTVVAIIFTLIMLTLKVEEIFLMEDPSIQNFSKPLSD